MTEAPAALVSLDAAAVAALLDPRGLVDALQAGFRAVIEAPPRSHHATPAAAATAAEAARGDPAQGGGMLMVMPAWRGGAAIGVKLVTYFPGNAGRGLSLTHASYVLFDGTTGQPRLILDGTELTRRRTAALAALAARHLARPRASRLLVVGTGSLAPHCARAHAAVLPIRNVRIWGRDPAKAAAVARELAGEPFTAEAASDLRAAVAWAEVIVCATAARAPLVEGDWLSPGQHLGLLGSFQAGMCETDDAALSRGRVFVDTREAALAEAGELLGAIARGRFQAGDIAGDLRDLARGTVAGRGGAEEITLFKSVGTGIADLAAAEYALERLGQLPSG